MTRVGRWIQAATGRRGYTMVEMLIVIALIGMLAATVLPGAMSIYGRSRLNQAVNHVQAVLSETRRTALELGAPTEFVIEPNGRQYGAFVTGTGSGSFESAGAWHTNAALPADLRFVVVKGLLPAVGGSAANRILSLPAGAVVVPFEADGTAVDAVFEVIDSESHRITVSVRGLTGATDVSGIRTGDLQ